MIHSVIFTFTFFFSTFPFSSLFILFPPNHTFLVKFISRRANESKQIFDFHWRYARHKRELVCRELILVIQTGSTMFSTPFSSLLYSLASFLFVINDDAVNKLNTVFWLESFWRKFWNLSLRGYASNNFEFFVKSSWIEYL